jgi:amidase
MTIPGLNYATACAKGVTVAQAPVPKAEVAETASPYDVVEKTIGEMRADMEAGRVTSQQITWAYLDRIAVYDKGQLGFNAYEVVASDAMAQALAADRARAAGRTGPLLGIPIALKNLYDTKDMPTTNGSLTFAGFQPARDAFQVARLREAGAVLIGKAALEEYATSGNYSNDAWGQVWNAFNPSKSSIASSGGSAVAVAVDRVERRIGSRRGRESRGRRARLADRRLALRAGQRGQPRHAARHRRTREWHGHHAAFVAHRLRWCDDPLRGRPRRHAQRRRRHGSR